MGGRVLHVLVAAAAVVVLAAVGADHAASGSGVSEAQSGGIFRISLAAASGIDYMDPALASTPPGWALLDTTCARLMSYPDVAPPAGFRLQPEVAADFPTVSRDGKTFTFRLRTGFRFSDGSPVRATAFARAINRVISPEMRSPGLLYVRDIVGAGKVVTGKAQTASGVVARGNTLVVRSHPSGARFSQPDGVDLLLRRAPHLPIDRRGSRRVSRGRAVLRRPTTAGASGSSCNGTGSTAGPAPTTSTASRSISSAPSPQDMLRRVDRGEADWGHTLAGVYFDPSLGLVEKYGTNRSQLYLRPGLTLRMLAFNSARPLFRDNPRLRKAVNFALDRRALVLTGGPLVSRASDQYLPPILPGFRDADVYPLERPDLERAKELAQGSLRGGRPSSMSTRARSRWRSASS